MSALGTNDRPGLSFGDPDRQLLPRLPSLGIAQGQVGDVEVFSGQAQCRTGLEGGPTLGHRVAHPAQEGEVLLGQQPHQLSPFPVFDLVCALPKLRRHLVPVLDGDAHLGQHLVHLVGQLLVGLLAIEAPDFKVDPGLVVGGVAVVVFTHRQTRQVPLVIPVGVEDRVDDLVDAVAQ